MDWDKAYTIVQRKQFILAGRRPAAWKNSALNLKRASDRLRESSSAAERRNHQRLMDELQSGALQAGSRVIEGEELSDFLDSQLRPVVSLLTGYSIENLLKGILVFRDPQLVDDVSGKIAQSIKTHRLLDLARKCRIAVTNEEEGILESITAQIEWRGKYPGPLKVDQMLPLKKRDGTWLHSHNVSDQALEDIWGRIYVEFEKCCGG